MNIYERNIRVFQENRILATSKYKTFTDSLLNSTKVYKSPLRCKTKEKLGVCRLEFDRNDTISSVLYWTRQGYKVCALNFADAITPGGLVFQGEVTQEEDLCRCSNLYESLIKPECIENYYNYNNSLGTSIFSDRVIYSKGVYVFRESLNYSILTKPIKCDIVTCPAPILRDKDLYYKTVLNRIRGILKVVESNNVNAIVLGAWGCGAFCGDARLVGRAFSEVIREFTCFDLVVFSVKSTINDSVDNFKLLKYGFDSYSV